ncbi:hypothetical protein HQ946_05315 [Enterococcus faecium]|uniref:hypothetical protein n=1 Tax=Enterococcus faecium TaxID=1352 RepID=UPI001921625A|nr:hypothetical protein [Enterococcus faecium]NTS28275.1 hypothetical protein [Enterococcus faecium]
MKLKDGFYKSAHGIGGLADFPAKSSKQQKEVKFKVGDKCRCIPRKDTPWIFSFVGEVEKIYNNSAMIKIISTHLEDDHLVNFYGGRTVVPLDRIGVLRTCETSKTGSIYPAKC